MSSVLIEEVTPAGALSCFDDAAGERCCAAEEPESFQTQCSWPTTPLSLLKEKEQIAYQLCCGTSLSQRANQHALRLCSAERGA